MIYLYLALLFFILGIAIGYFFENLKNYKKILIILIFPLIGSIFVHEIYHLRGIKEVWMWALISIPIMYMATTPNFAIGLWLGSTLFKKCKRVSNNK